jgi:hypothetical protein
MRSDFRKRVQDSSDDVPPKIPRLAIKNGFWRDSVSASGPRFGLVKLGFGKF